MTKQAQRQAVLAAIARREWLLQMLALGAAGCGRGEDRAYSRGNTLIAAVDDDDRPLTPDEIAEYLVYLPLVRIDEHGDRQPCLATEWTHSADYLEWTYRLRPNVRWHDGRPVTVDDVKFTIDLHARPDSPVYYGLRTECTVHDPSTFTVRGINWTRGTEADSYVSIVPKHLLKDLDYQKWYEWEFWLRPVGNGPYRYLRHQPGSMVELEANPDYYKGTPTVARVVLKFTGEASLTELLSGNVDAIQLDELAQLPALANDPRFLTYWPNPVQSWAIVWQNEHPLFRRSRVRAREFEAAVCSQRVVGIRPESFFGEQSPIGYRNPQLTKLLESLRTTADPDARDQAHREMSDLLRRDQPITFLLRGASGQVVHRRIKGLSAPWRADPLAFTDDLWLEKER